MSMFQDIIDLILGTKKPVELIKNIPIIEKSQLRFIEVKNLPANMVRCPDLKGVYINGCCVEPDKKWIPKTWGVAHAHTHDPYAGYICFMNEAKFTPLIMEHEVAHFLSKNMKRVHGKKWAEEFLKLNNGRTKFLTMEFLSKKYKFAVKNKEKKT